MMMHRIIHVGRYFVAYSMCIAIALCGTVMAYHTAGYLVGVKQGPRMSSEVMFVLLIFVMDV